MGWSLNGRCHHETVTCMRGDGDVQADVFFLCAASALPVLEVRLDDDEQRRRLGQLHNDSDLDGMWDVFVVWCTWQHRHNGVPCLSQCMLGGVDRLVHLSPETVGAFVKLRNVSLLRACTAHHWHDMQLA